MHCTIEFIKVTLDHVGCYVERKTDNMTGEILSIHGQAVDVRWHDSDKNRLEFGDDLRWY